MLIGKGDMLKFIKKEDQILFDKVLAEGQDHVFQWWDELSGASRQKLLTQLRQIDFHLLGQLNEKFSVLNIG